MVEVKLNVSAVIAVLREETDGLNIANDTKMLIVEHLQGKLLREIQLISRWAKEVTELQDKRTIQTKDWEFIKKKLSQ